MTTLAATSSTALQERTGVRTTERVPLTEMVVRRTEERL